MIDNLNGEQKAIGGVVPCDQKKYNIIYADPPWKLNISKNRPEWGDATYPTMKTKEICELPVYNICLDNCALFMWVTMPFLEEGFNVINSWGFKYVTCAFVWVKQNRNGAGIFSGLGQWVNGNAELCLFARRGKLIRKNKNVKQIVLSPVGTHSKKPDEIKHRIINLLGDLPRIELFARHKTEGWDVWGNEVENDISLPLIPKGQGNCA